jgi:hypothetical protein
VTADDLEMARVRVAIDYVHGETCYDGTRRPAPCPMCPRPAGVLAALALLDNAPRDARGARRALHDVVCASGCGPESDHADRTQSRGAAALRKFRTLEASA